MPTMTHAGYTPPKPQPPKKPAARPKKKRKKKTRLTPAAIVSMAIFLVACVIGAGTIFVYMQTAPYANTFLPGTMLLGYPLAGTTMENAQDLLDQITKEDIASWRAEMTWEKQSYVLTGEDVNLGIDREATLSALWQRGREGGMLARFVDMLKLSQEPMIARPVLVYDMAAADELLALIKQDIDVQSADATVSFTPGSAEPFAFTGETVGYSLDIAPIRSAIESAIRTVESTVIALEPEVMEPDVTLEDLQGAISLRSRVVMEISADEAAYTNVYLAASMLGGVRIEPGETLSFNEAVGARTSGRGYQTALEPAYGQNVSGTGGGVCQLSSAVYQAALLGCMEIVEHNAAVRPLDYCEKGLEAAVSDNGIDLAIRNDSAYPLFLRARTYTEDDAAYVEVQLIGEALDARYALESVVTETLRIEEPVYVRDSEGTYAAYMDERVPVGEAQEGYVVTVSRVTLSGDGEEIARETVAEETYEAFPPTIYVGVKTRE